MKAKPEVSLIGLNPNMLKVLKFVDNIWKSFGKEAVITAGTEAFSDVNFNDGLKQLIHCPGSKHTVGCALDFRTKYFDDETLKKVAVNIQTELGYPYRVIVEKTHIHIQYEP